MPLPMIYRTGLTFLFERRGEGGCLQPPPPPLFLRMFLGVACEIKCVVVVACSSSRKLRDGSSVKIDVTGVFLNGVFIIEVDGGREEGGGAYNTLHPYLSSNVSSGEACEINCVVVVVACSSSRKLLDGSSVKIDVAGVFLNGVFIIGVDGGRACLRVLRKRLLYPAVNNILADGKDFCTKLLRAFKMPLPLIYRTGLTFLLERRGGAAYNLLPTPIFSSNVTSREGMKSTVFLLLLHVLLPQENFLMVLQ
ncbi:hypothetical protein CEXT_404871 [Caerostris extrusa]|uniref:Uncharacterized protein n=1 Tax=Caerostris extrusa TaxID=172846 RepID=A0AAV4NUI9_CAEEX|nr:hypothetical protein CEXT_404871 [Caerostris extrusa]